MKSKYLILILFSLFFLIPSKVFADCSNNEIGRLKTLASNVNVSYDPIESDNGLTYNIVFLNMTNELAIRDTDSRTSYYYTDNEMILTGYQPNVNYKFKIIPSNGCDVSLAVKYVNLPAFNNYYKDPLCEGLSDYTLCQKWNNSNVSYESFVTEVTKYKQSLIRKDNPVENQIAKTTLDIIFSFLASYYYIIYILIIVILVPIIIILKRREKLL